MLDPGLREICHSVGRWVGAPHLSKRQKVPKLINENARIVSFYFFSLGGVWFNSGMPASAPSPREITALLADTGYWDRADLDEVAPLVYDELRRLAHSYMSGERPDHTLQTTALVNEAYLRLAERTNPRWQNRGHFFAGAARLMRHILVDHARRRNRGKRGDGTPNIEFTDSMLLVEQQAEQVLDLNDALERLLQVDRRAAQVVELKYFGGMNYDEMAEVLGLSAITVRREWDFAKAWLHKQLT